MKVSVNSKDKKIVQGSSGFIVLFVCFSRVFKDVKVTEQVRGCVADNHPHGLVILQKCLK